MGVSAFRGRFLVGWSAAVEDGQDGQGCGTQVADLDIPTRIEVLPIIRETDGLAMSSRAAGSTPTSASAPPLCTEASSWRNRRWPSGNETRPSSPAPRGLRRFDPTHRQHRGAPMIRTRLKSKVHRATPSPDNVAPGRSKVNLLNELPLKPWVEPAGHDLSFRRVAAEVPPVAERFLECA